MIYIFGTLIFLLVLFLYIHIQFHLKTSDDLDMYDIETPSKDKLEEICDMRQPVVFPFVCELLAESFTRDNIANVYGVYDVNVKSKADTSRADTSRADTSKADTSKADTDDAESYTIIAFNKAIKLIEKDSENQYIIENNNEFLDETSLKKIMKSNDGFLRPYAVSSCEYDINIASQGSHTPFKYELNNRNYLYVSQGEIKVRLAPPKNRKYLHLSTDYDNFVFSSPINPWDVQDNYKEDFSKVKCLDAIVSKGQILFIPAYWMYSVEFREKATICVFKYRTFMSSLAILPKLIMRLLQSHNIKHIVFNKMKKQKNNL